MSVHATPARPGVASRRIEIRCEGCGYGGVVTRLPDRCPMCGGTTWRKRPLRSGRASRR